MKARCFSFCFFVCLLLAPSAVTAKVSAPLEVGGFKLGTSIDDYEYISYHNFLKQVVVENVGEFRKGIIEYGVCEKPGSIVRIKLKYADSKFSFYEELLKRYTRKFGKPTYVGDAFGILKAWKWRFKDADGNRVSVRLQFNKKNPDESFGTVVKLSLPDRIEAERLCFNKMCDIREEKSEKPKKHDWGSLIPK